MEDHEGYRKIHVRGRLSPVVVSKSRCHEDNVTAPCKRVSVGQCSRLDDGVLLGQSIVLINVPAKQLVIAVSKPGVNTYLASQG